MRALRKNHARLILTCSFDVRITQVLAECFFQDGVCALRPKRRRRTSAPPANATPPGESMSLEQLLVAEPSTFQSAEESDGGGGLVTWIEDGLGSQPQPEPEPELDDLGAFA